jgi:hypothetical protein
MRHREGDLSVFSADYFESQDLGKWWPKPLRCPIISLSGGHSMATTSRNIDENGQLLDRVGAANDARQFLSAAANYCQWQSKNSQAGENARAGWRNAAEELHKLARDTPTSKQ